MGNNKGFSVVIVAAFMFAAVFLLGLGIDVAYLYQVKGELQVAADAGALAGAGELFPATPYPPATSFPRPEFGESKTVARAFAKKNQAAGELLKGGEVEADSGYWNLAGTSSELKAHTIDPVGKCSGTGMTCRADAECMATESCQMLEVPAVLVTVKKEAPSFFTTAFGFNSFQVQATAVAARGYPKMGRPFPMAVSYCMVREYFGQNPLPDLEITIESAYGRVPNCNTGQWTSLTSGSNSATEIKNLMYSQPAPLRIGDSIHIAPGTMENLYLEVQQNFIGKEVQLPVVLDPTLNTNATVPVMAFVRFKITGIVAEGPGIHRIKGRFLAYYEDKDAGSPGGPRGNIVTPPTLVK